MKLKIAGIAFAAFALVVMQAPMADAQTPDVTTTESAVVETSPSLYASMLATLQSLMAKVEALQAQLLKVTGQIDQLLGENIQEGISNDDVKTVQELLATDPDIYPEGLTTGYFGPLTKKAIERFQEKHDLDVNGKVDEDTRELMEAFLENDDDEDEDHVSEGLLRRSDIAEKARVTGCERAKTLCLTPSSERSMSDDESDDENMMDDESDDEDMMDDESDDENMMDDSDENDDDEGSDSNDENEDDDEGSDSNNENDDEMMDDESSSSSMMN